ncbi:hypothetical protein PENTCL1PPCAC_14634, partial [Pristionchus entomophagus]
HTSIDWRDWEIMLPWSYPLDSKTPDRVEVLRSRFHILNELCRATLCEFFCTAFLLTVGCCASAQYILSRGEVVNYFGNTIGWIVALFFAITIGYRSSGSHLNPAVSFFQLTIGNISLIRFVLFVIAQNLGAFVGASIAYAVYYEAIADFDGGHRAVSGELATAGIFATYPSPHLSMIGACFDQTVATAVLCIGIGTITDKRNHVPMFMQPAFIASHVMLIGMGLAWNAGYAINPARDFGPRVFTALAGWGWEVFEFNDYQWFWIPVMCPMLGALIGAWLYQAFIGFHMPDIVYDEMNYDCRPVKTINNEAKLREDDKSGELNRY